VSVTGSLAGLSLGCLPDGTGAGVSPCSILHWKAMCCKLATNSSLSIAAIRPSNSGCGVASAASMKWSISTPGSMASSSNCLLGSCDTRVSSCAIRSLMDVYPPLLGSEGSVPRYREAGFSGRVSPPRSVWCRMGAGRSRFGGVASNGAAGPAVIVRLPSCCG